MRWHTVCALEAGSWRGTVLLGHAGGWSGVPGFATHPWRPAVQRAKGAQGVWPCRSAARLATQQHLEAAARAREAKEAEDRANRYVRKEHKCATSPPDPLPASWLMTSSSAARHPLARHSRACRTGKLSEEEKAQAPGGDERRRQPARGGALGQAGERAQAREGRGARRERHATTPPSSARLPWSRCARFWQAAGCPVALACSRSTVAYSQAAAAPRPPSAEGTPAAASQVQGADDLSTGIGRRKYYSEKGNDSKAYRR